MNPDTRNLLFPSMAEILLGMAAWSIDGLWWLPQYMSDWRYAQWFKRMLGVTTLVFDALGMVCLLAPRGEPARWIGCFCFLRMVFSGTGNLSAGEAHFALLDVGQGQAAVVQTQNHTLVFDNGPRYSSGFNTGSAVLRPYLRARGVRYFDTLVVSHGDNDHAGGAVDLASQMPVTVVLSSVPEKLNPLAAKMCLAGDAWEWDGVRFEFLNPDLSKWLQKGRKANNHSCVLRVQTGGDSVLITGDIERGAERELVNRDPTRLASTVLVVPHHGSKTSSSAAFIDAVSPSVALFPVGYRNRYGFPKSAIVERYEAKNVKLFDSARHGAIEMTLNGKSRPETMIQTWRLKGARYWHYQDQSQN